MKSRMLVSTLFAGAVVCGLALAPAANAATTVYTNRAAWEAALAAPFSEEFFADAILNPGVTATSTVGTAFGGVWIDQVDDSPLRTTTFGFVPGIKSFGGNWDLSEEGAGNGIKLTLNRMGGPEVIGTEIDNSYTGGFFGVISDTTFDSVLLERGSQAGLSETFLLDNMVYSASGASPVPEPTSMALMTAGALPLLRRLRRNRKAQA